MASEYESFGANVLEFLGSGMNFNGLDNANSEA